MRYFTSYYSDTLTFNQLLHHLHVFKSDVVNWCAVSPRTVERYIKNDKAPAHIKRLIWFMACGLPASHGWENMRIDSDGLLHDGLGRCLSAGDIMATFYSNARLEHQTERIKKLQSVIDRLQSELSSQSHYAPANSPFYNA